MILLYNRYGVLSFPGGQFSKAQLAALYAAARLANFNVLQLIADLTAGNLICELMHTHPLTCTLHLHAHTSTYTHTHPLTCTHIHLHSHKLYTHARTFVYRNTDIIKVSSRRQKKKNKKEKKIR